MKKHIFTYFFFSLVVLMVTSCKKDGTTNQESPPIYSRSVKYQFYTSGTGNTYAVSYTGSDGTNVNEPVTLTSSNQKWTSVVVVINDIRVTKSVTVRVSSPTITTSTPITINITGGNDETVILSKTVDTFTSTNHDNSTTYTF